MNRKYVWIGIAILVSLSLLVSAASATQTTLKEGNVPISTSQTADYTVHELVGTSSGGIKLLIDYEQRKSVYDSYTIPGAILWNKTGMLYETIPDVVTQPVELDGHYGTGTIQVWKKSVATTGCAARDSCIIADLVFTFNIDQEWQNDITEDVAIVFRDEDYNYNFKSLYEYYEESGCPEGGDPCIFVSNSQNDPSATTIRDEIGLAISHSYHYYSSVFGSISSNIELNTLQSTREFYNEYEVYSDDTGFRGINITRVCSGCEDKLTESKVYVLNKTGHVLYHSDFYIDENTSHFFPAQQTAIWICAANMESDGTDRYVLVYDDTGAPTYCSVKGYTYDAEAGTVLTSVDVTLDAYSDTSDGDGYYFIGPVLAEKSYRLTASKSGYYDTIYSLYLAYEQDYSIDLPLIPEYPTHTGHGILGTVTTLPYHGICENHTVHIENATWSDTTTTNSAGYYLFDNLEVDDYWINVSKDAYRDNNQSVTVSATGDEIVTIDACDATTNWSSDNSLTLNTTDKQEGTGSLQSSGSNTLDFNKSAPTAIDASNVTKENGYMAFWYKVNDTTRITDYLVFTVGSNGDNTTHKISWSVYKSNFVSDTWEEVWLKFSDGTETGTLNMSDIDWLEVKAAKSDTVVSKIDNIRFYDFSYEIHHVDLDPILSLGVIAKTLNEEIIPSFIAILDSTSLNTTSGEELIFTNLSYGMHELTVTSEGYFPYQQSVYLDSNTNITAYMTTEEEGGAGVYYPPPHLVEFRVHDVWGGPLTGIHVTAMGYETTMGAWDWLSSIFGYKNETQIHNTTMSGITDSNGALSFLMVETIKYKMWFTNTSQNISAYREIYPKDDRYTITIGEIPRQKIAYWITTAQNNTANTGNISIHYCDYNSPVKTNWVNFSVYYGDNGTLVHTHNFTSPTDVNENTSIDLNASFVYKVKIVADHDDFGEIKSYSTVVFVMPEKPKFPIEGLEDWQITVFGMFVIIFAALIFGAVSSGVGGLVVTFMSAAFYYFGFLPLIPKAAAYAIFPLIIIVAIINIISEQKGSVEV